MTLIHTLFKALSTTAEVEGILGTIKNFFNNTTTRKIALVVTIVILLFPDSTAEDENTQCVTASPPPFVTPVPVSTATPEYFPQFLPYIPSQGITPSCINRESIRWVQRVLKMLGYYNDHVDGDWGPNTAYGVMEFQRDYNLESIGTNAVDRVTAEKMLEVFISFGNPLEALAPYCP